MKSQEESHLVHSNTWLMVAVREFNMLRDHYNMGSCNQVAKELGCSRETVGKLNKKHPDPTLRLATLLKLYSRLLQVQSYKAPPHKILEEEIFILQSFGRIMKETYTLPEKVIISLIEEGYLNENGTRKGFFK